jgi:hypothetical protein
MNAEELLIRTIEDKQNTRDDVAVIYRRALDTEGINWARVNRAIMDRWSQNALVYIKHRAWRRLLGRVA